MAKYTYLPTYLLLNVFMEGSLAEHIPEWQKLTSDKLILQMVRGDTIEFENDTPIKHNAKNLSFSPVLKPLHTWSQETVSWPQQL